MTIMPPPGVALPNIARGIWWGDLCLTEAPFGVRFGDGTDFDPGEPGKVLQAIAQELRDGEIVSSPRASNREITFQVVVEFDELWGRAEAEALLALQGERERSTLRIVPGDIYGPATVYDTFTASSLRWVPNDEADAQGFSVYEVTIPARPYPRSEDVVAEVLQSAAVQPTSVVVDDGSSASGWATTSVVGVNNISGPSASGGKIKVTGNILGPISRLYMEKTGLNISVTGAPYLFIKYDLTEVDYSNYQAQITITTDAGSRTKIPFRSPGGDNLTEWITLPENATVITSIFIGFQYTDSPSTRPTVTLAVDEITTYTTPYGRDYTGRQTPLDSEIVGTQRAPATIGVKADTGLSDLMVFTGGRTQTPPNLVNWMVSGPNVTLDSSTVSGQRTQLTTQHEFSIPVANVPEGTYHLVTRVRAGSTTTRTLTYATRYKIGGNTSSDQQTGTIDVTLTANQWKIVPIANLRLPDRAMGNGGEVLIRLKADSTTELDEAWLFNITDGQLTMLAAGSHKRVWLDAADLDRPVQSIWVGDSSGRSDASIADPESIQSYGAHEFEPGNMSLFVVTTGATDAETTLTYYPHWHTWAAL